MLDAAATALVRRPWLVLVVALVLETVVFVFGQADFVASDPLWYADVAHNLAKSPSAVFANHETHPFIMRIGLTMPLALLYRVFGVSTLVSNLPSLFSVLGILLVIYAAAPTSRAKLLGVLFGVFCTPLVQHAVILNIDLPASALMALCVLCVSRRDRPRGRWWLAGGAAAWIAAFLVKESAVWCVVVWIFALVVDLSAAGVRRVARAWAPALVTGGALGAGYLLLCAVLWGDPLARFHGIQDLTYEHAWGLHGHPAREWIDRLTWQPPRAIYRMFHLTLVPVLAAPWLVRGAERIWLHATAAFVLLYWFGSSSMTAYTPLPISERMMLPFLPGMLVLAAVATDRALDRLTGWRWRAPIAVVIAVWVVWPATRAAIAEVRRPTPETEAFAVVRAEAADPGRHVVVVCAEPRCVSIGGFYFGLETPSNVTLVFAGDFVKAPLPASATVRALVNLPRSEGAHRTDPKLDLTKPIDALGLPRLAGDNDIHLVDAGDGARLWTALQSPP